MSVLVIIKKMCVSMLPIHHEYYVNSLVIVEHLLIPLRN